MAPGAQPWRGSPSPRPVLRSRAGLGGSLPRRQRCRQQSSWYFHARQANELFSLAAMLLYPTALHNVGGCVRRRSAEASTLSKGPTRQAIGKTEMKSAGLRPTALRACDSHHQRLLQALLLTMKLQEAPSSPQATKPPGGRDEGGEFSLRCFSQPVRDAHTRCQLGESVLFWQLALGCRGGRCLFPLKTHSHEGAQTLRFQKRGGINPFKSWLYPLPQHGAYTAPPFQIPPAPHAISSPGSPSLGLPLFLSGLFHVQGLKFRYFLN